MDRYRPAHVVDADVVLLAIAALTYVAARYAVPAHPVAPSRTASRWDDAVTDRKLLNRLS